ncbi:MAG: hypothetical protein V1871_07680 [Planctomycetota bacterium]
MIEKYGIILWLAYFIVMGGLCFLCRALRIIQKSDINFYLVYTLVMGCLCVLFWYFDIKVQSIRF